MYIIPMATLSIGGRYFAMMLLPFASGEPCLESPLREADGVSFSRTSNPHVQERQPAHCSTYREACCRSRSHERHRWNIKHLDELHILRASSLFRCFWDE